MGAKAGFRGYRTLAEWYGGCNFRQRPREWPKLDAEVCGRCAQFLGALEGTVVRFVNMYFVGYVILVMGVALALWRSGILNDVAPVWIGIGVVIALGLGIMMSVGSGKPDITHE